MPRTDTTRVETGAKVTKIKEGKFEDLELPEFRDSRTAVTWRRRGGVDLFPSEPLILRKLLIPR